MLLCEHDEFAGRDCLTSHLMDVISNCWQTTRRKRGAPRLDAMQPNVKFTWTQRNGSLP